jgi:hypothetical protein
MITSKAQLPVQADSQMPGKPGQAEVGRKLPQPVPRQKPTGPIIYNLDKGADVWPGLKQD